MTGVTLFVHAARVSIEATRRALIQTPNVRARHVLNEGLVDARASGFAPGAGDYARLRDFVHSALDAGVADVVLSCSVYNGFAGRLSADLELPVERSDDAGALEAARFGRIGLAVSYPPSYELIRAHVERHAAVAGAAVAVLPVLGGNAFAFASDPVAYARALREGVRTAEGIDAIFLAQYSMDPYAGELRETAAVPLISALQSTLRRRSLRPVDSGYGKFL